MPVRTFLRSGLTVWEQESPHFREGRKSTIVNGIGTTIHQCVWQLMLANTGIDSREYLPFGGNYSKYLAELLEDFGEVPVAKGIQIYTENLIDYYLSKLKYH